MSAGRAALTLKQGPVAGHEVSSTTAVLPVFTSARIRDYRSPKMPEWARHIRNRFKCLSQQSLQTTPSGGIRRTDSDSERVRVGSNVE